jgi:hypothetical protein
MKNGVFTTTDTGLAAYLVASGEVLESVKSIQQNKVGFCFTDSNKRNELVSNYMAGDDKISASAFLRSYRHLKEKIFEFKERR